MGNIGRHNTASGFRFTKQKPQLAVACKQAETRMVWADELDAEANHCINPEVAAAFRKAAAQVRAESRKPVQGNRKGS
jgi:hypothetical protein